MNANELRIGNLIYTPSGYKKRVDVINDTKNKIEFDDSDDDYSVFQCNPIELTEEILLKAGYKKQNGYGYSNYNIYGTILKNDNGFEFHYYGIIIRLDFVHQLQNLFFSFYGEDLVFSTEP